MAEVLYARAEHGGHRVVPMSSGIQVDWPHGAATYPSARQAIIALVNQTPKPTPEARDPHLTFDRYFRRGRFRRPPRDEGSLNVFDFFSPSGLAFRKPSQRIRLKPVLTVHQPKPRGIDLGAKGHEVRKLFYAGFGKKALYYGYDPDDVLQEVYQGLLVRNRGKCPFDPNKSTFGHYVYMVAGCILSNYHRRYLRVRQNEVYGACLPDGTEVDVAETDFIWEGPTQEDNAIFDSVLQDLVAQIVKGAEQNDLDPSEAVEVLHLLRQGQRNKEISEITGISGVQVSKLVKLVKQTALTTL